MKKETKQRNDQRRCATRHILRLFLLLLSFALISAGCKPEVKAPADIDPVGTYALASIDGNTLPCSLTHQGSTLTVKSGAFTINADATCTSKVVFGAPTGGDVSREVKATYTREGSKLTMKWEGAGITTGTVEGNQFTMENEGMIFVYRK